MNLKKKYFKQSRENMTKIIIKTDNIKIIITKTIKGKTIRNIRNNTQHHLEKMNIKKDKDIIIHKHRMQKNGHKNKNNKKSFIKDIKKNEKCRKINQFVNLIQC
jgi:hypothetical protein